jgi:adenylate cyclase class IV
MKVAQEYEKKFQSLFDITELANSLDITFEEGNGQVDMYFDTGNAELFLRGIFLRVRDSKSFQIKVNLDDLASGRSSGHTRCTEIETPLTFGRVERDSLRPIMRAVGLELGAAESCYELFERNDLLPSVNIDKRRSRSVQPWGYFYFDEVLDLGYFLEVEAGNAENFDEGMQTIFDRVDHLLTNGTLAEIDTGYNALFWRKTDFNLYLKCPYVMQRDRLSTNPRVTV